MSIKHRCIATYFLPTTFAVMIFFAAGPIFAQSCPEVFKSLPRASAVKSLFTPNALLLNAVAYGEAMDAEGEKKGYSEETLVPKSFYKAFFTRALENLDRIETNLLADYKNPNSVYKHFVDEIETHVLPRFEPIRQKIKGQFFQVNRSTFFNGGLRSTITLGELMKLADEVADLMNYQTTKVFAQVFDNYIRYQLQRGSNTAIQRWAEEHYLGPDSDPILALQEFVYEEIYILDALDQITSSLTLFYHLRTSFSRDRPVHSSFVRNSNYIPYLSWAAPNEWTQLVVRSKRVHIFSYSDRVTSFDGLKDVLPSYGPAHDDGHMRTSAANSGGAYSDDLASFNKWIYQYRDFLDFLKQALISDRYTDSDRYAAIHYLDLLQHETGRDYRVALADFEKTVAGSSIQFGEAAQLVGRKEEVARRGLEIVSGIVEAFYQAYPDYGPRRR